MKHRIAMLTTAHRHDDVRIFSKEAKTLSEAGWQVDIINSYYEGNWDGINFIRAKIPAGRFGRFLLGREVLKKELLKRDAEIIMLHDPELIPMLPLLKKKGYISVFDAHEDVLSSISDRRWIWPGFRKAAWMFTKAMMDSCLSSTDALVAATDTISDKLGENAVVVRNRVTGEDCRLYDEAINQYKG
jgi:hypothetical protein